MIDAPVIAIVDDDLSVQERDDERAVGQSGRFRRLVDQGTALARDLLTRATVTGSGHWSDRAA